MIYKAAPLDNLLGAVLGQSLDYLQPSHQGQMSAAATQPFYCVNNLTTQQHHPLIKPQFIVSDQVRNIFIHHVTQHPIDEILLHDIRH